MRRIRETDVGMCVKFRVKFLVGSLIINNFCFFLVKRAIEYFSFFWFFQLDNFLLEISILEMPHVTILKKFKKLCKKELFLKTLNY